MKPFGIAALVFSIFGVIIPVLGPFISGLSGMLASLSAGRGTTLGVSAVIINIINVLFLSPSLILASDKTNPFTGAAYNDPVMLQHAQDSQTIWGVLVLIQIVALLVFLVVWLIGRNKRDVQYAD